MKNIGKIAFAGGFWGVIGIAAGLASIHLAAKIAEAMITAKSKKETKEDK